MSAQQINYSGWEPIYRTELKRCPECGHKDNCSVSRNRAMLICGRVRSERVARDGRWLHVLRSDRPLPSQSVRYSEPTIARTALVVPVANRRMRSVIYSALLRHLRLLPAHRDDLTRRGLTTEAIERGGFRSTPPLPSACEITKELSGECSLAGVAGFFKSNSRWQMVKVPSGFFIPICDSEGLIQGLQIRRDYLRNDKDCRYLWFSSKSFPFGTGSGAPAHIQNPERVHATGKLIITEGALKSFVAAQFLDANEGGILGLAGVSTFRENIGTRLRHTWPNLQNVAIAFDRDWHEKLEVKRQLYRLIQSLKQASFASISVRTWEREKGIDDYLRSENLSAEVATA